MMQIIRVTKSKVERQKTKGVLQLRALFFDASPSRFMQAFPLYDTLKTKNSILFDEKITFSLAYSKYL